ncbi:MAG: hypothetical protein HOV80_11555 [Polyangiaceae bacterium]|nr:hypothetical protein [Polyangiaceae bacterium]
MKTKAVKTGLMGGGHKPDMSQRRTTFLSLLGVVGLAALAAGCSSEVEYPYSFDGVESASLQRAKSCNDLEKMLKADASSRMNKFIDLQISSIRYWEAQDDEFSMFGGRAMDENGDGSVGSGAPTMGAEDGAAPPAHSETNTQIEGVDEADIVKTDGNHVYVLHGPTLTVVNSFPVAELAVSASIAIEGQPFEMFIEGNKAVIYSAVNGDSVYTQAGKAPPSRAGGGEFGPDCYDCGYWYNPITKITVLDITSTAAPTVLAEHFIEGNYVSARRIGTRIQTVVTGGSQDVFALYPDFYRFDYDNDDSEDMIRAYEELRARNEIAIHSATLDELLPDHFIASTTGIEDAGFACEDVYVPTSGTTEFGTTQIHSLDLAALEAESPTTIVFGSTQTIYQNQDTLVLAAQSWSQHLSMGPVWDLSDEPVSLVGTHLHSFALTEGDGRPAYRASATVPGALSDQFALDEKDGVLRIATTEQIASRSDWGRTANAMFTLGDGDGGLSPLGEVRDLAPGESIYATRYVGDRAYVVTFRQVDPLFVFDLSNPSEPKLTAELKIPGFSEYMHPLNGGTHLLTIGVDGDEDGANGAIALQIFDVTDAAAPKLTHKFPLTDEQGWSWSEALYNHKAMTFYEDVLAFPVEGYTTSPQSGLALFRIDPTNGITELGRISHTPYFNGGQSYDYCYYGYGVRRGVFIEDHVLSISEAAIVASPIETPSVTTAAIELPKVSQESCGYYYGE